jgi:hypothetical protein
MLFPNSKSKTFNFMVRREALKKVSWIGGSTVLGSSLFSLLQSCQSKPRINWKPLFFSQEQAEFISVLVDTLLPKTQTPGALDMKVDIFIDLVVNKMFNETGQKSFVDGIMKMEEVCKEKYDKNFVDLEPADRNEILKSEEVNSGKYNGQVWGTRVGVQKPVGFYRSLKSLALWGYFSSEEIGKNILTYDPIPGEYLGCIPLSDVGNTWSL